MSIKFQRVIDRLLGVPVCALLSLLERFRPKRSAITSPRRILVIQLSEMGTLVLAQPMLARLKQRYPEASLLALVFARNAESVRLRSIVHKDPVGGIEERALLPLCSS